MIGVKIIGPELQNLPWQEKPAECGDVVWRHGRNPVSDWNPTKNISRVYNCALIPFEGGFIGVFRGDGKDGKARLYVAKSKDGLTFDVDDQEIVWKDESGKLYQPFYAYDPRLARIGDWYYVVWCTEFGGGPALGLGKTKDFREFIRMENICLPCNRNGVLFPRKIGGNFVLLSRPSDAGHTAFGDIFISESPDLAYWGRHRKVMGSGGSGWWQGLKIGAGPVPIETSEGWLLFYHGVSNTCNGYVYSMGAAILDIDQPSRVLYRTRDFLLTPETAYETVGAVPNVIFPVSALCDAATGRIAIYYGAADTHIAVAYTQVDMLIKFIKTNSELLPGDAEVGI